MVSHSVRTCAEKKVDVSVSDLLSSSWAIQSNGVCVFGRVWALMRRYVTDTFVTFVRMQHYSSDFLPSKSFPVLMYAIAKKLNSISVRFTSISNPIRHKKKDKKTNRKSRRDSQQRRCRARVVRIKYEIEKSIAHIRFECARFQHKTKWSEVNEKVNEKKSEFKFEWRKKTGANQIEFFVFLFFYYFVIDSLSRSPSHLFIGTYLGTYGMTKKVKTLSNCVW